jgi:autophagy-related protein 101
MNARSQLFEYTVEVGQAEEVVLSLFHTLLLHRTQGKIRRSAREAAGGESSSSLSIGSLGFEDVDCDLVDFSYVRCASPTLCARVGGSVRLFVDELQRTDAKNGQISMEFYKRRRGPWLLNAETMPWEVWTVQLAVTTLPTEYDRQVRTEDKEIVICMYREETSHQN